MGEAGSRAQGATRRRGSGRRSPRKEQEAAGWRKQGESEAAMSCGPRKLRGAESARKEQKTRQRKDSCSGRRRKQEVGSERVDVGNEVVPAYVAEEGRDGSWASRARKGEATVGCGRASCGGKSLQKENEVVLTYVVEERGEGNCAGRVRKGEATVGCQELAGRERKRRTTKRYLTFSFKVKMALGSAEQGGKAWQERPAVKAVEEG